MFATTGNLSSNNVTLQTYMKGINKLLHCRSVESYVEVDSLAAFTSYKFLLFECGGSKALFNKFDIETEHDSKY